jgi:integrase
MQAKVKKSLQLVPGVSIFYPRYPLFRRAIPLGSVLDRKSNKKDVCVHRENRSQPLSYTYVWKTLDAASKAAGIGHISSHTFRHTYRTWLDSEGTPFGVQQKCMRRANIRTTMNQYGDALSEDMRQALQKVASRAIPETYIT